MTFPDVLDRVRAVFNAYSDGEITSVERARALDALEADIVTLPTGDQTYLHGYIEGRLVTQDRANYA
jgi:hypothetical protein